MPASLRWIVTAAFALFVAAPALAQDSPKLIGEYRAWSALQYKERGDDVCYMAASPQKWVASRDGARRGEIYTLVTHRPDAGIRSEVSINVGYPLKKDSEVTVDIDGQKYTLFVDNDTAWARDAETDRKIVQAMIRGSTMVIRGTSERGTRTTDTYSLSGFTAAHNAINKACRVR